MQIGRFGKLPHRLTYLNYGFTIRSKLNFDSLMKQTENRKEPTLEEILEREANGNSPWRRAWAKAQKMLINPEKYEPEEIIAVEKDFLEMESGLDDGTDRMEIASRNLLTTVPLLSSIIISILTS
jgi:hypothetical protein